MTSPRPPLDLARRALASFGLPSASITLLRRGDNTVYRVDEPHGRPRVLRLHTARRHDREALDAELTWLAYLSEHLPAQVPKPHRSSTGAFTGVVTDDVGAPLLCSVLGWVDGTPLEEGVEFTAQQAALMGDLLATIHVLAEQFRPPPNFQRPTYHPAYFQAFGNDLRDALTPDEWPLERSRALRANVTDLIASLGDWRALPGGTGLLHADAHPGNVVQQRSALGLLDWDRCGFGPFLLDLAGVTLALEEAERTTFLERYSRVRPLPDGVARPLRVLRVLAALENLGVLVRRPEERPFVLEALVVLEEVAATVRAS